MLHKIKKKKRVDALGEKQIFQRRCLAVELEDVVGLQVKGHKERAELVAEGSTSVSDT